LLAEYQKKTFVFLELGLQTAHNHTLNLLNRGHSAEEFFDALKRTQERRIPVATHLIFGLPGETREDMLHSVRLVANSGVDAIKIHQLVVYKDAPMAKDYLDGQISLIEENDYVQLVADALEMLPEDMTVMRLVAEGTKEEVLAPKWCLNKFATMDLINQEMSRRNSQQGAKYVKENLDELLAQSGYNLAQFLPLTTIVAAPITPA
jgi:radical SAM protein (TIGR01212 family)